MHIILGATGHIGSALAQTLIERGEPVTVVSRDSEKAREWQEKGAHVAVADVHDTQTLRQVFRQGTQLFLLNPPAPPSTDTDSEERKSLASILAALDGSGLEKIVAQSAYGVQQGSHIGDLGVLYEMEQALAAQPIPYSVIRGAYYMSNWEMALETVQKESKVHTFFPTDFKLPMVAPEDIGQLAAQLLTEPDGNTGLHYIEGPEYYSPEDVVAAFAAALNKPVKAVETPREQWLQAYKAVGFSDQAAQSYAAMTAITVNAQFPIADVVTKGVTSLQQYVDKLVQKANSSE